MEKIYLLKSDKIMIGPFTVEKLKEKNIKPSDLIWYEGLADWTPAGNILKLGSSAAEKNSREKFTIKAFLKRLFSSPK